MDIFEYLIDIVHITVLQEKDMRYTLKHYTFTTFLTCKLSSSHSPPQEYTSYVDTFRQWPCTNCYAPLPRGARCSSVVRAFTHGAMGHRIDPSLG